MKNFAGICLCTILLLSATSCTKIIDAVVKKAPNSYSQYLIRQGQHYCDQSTLRSVNYSSVKFGVQFDSTAIYQTIDPSNQEDINKLYGFSDNNSNHQQSSARIGWNWARNALRLYAYVYNDGVRNSREICAISIGSNNTCSIAIVGNKYIFMVNDAVVEMTRTAAGTSSNGYQLYPYFGGDETAPHDIRIAISEL